jgi:hypothetical protein
MLIKSLNPEGSFLGPLSILLGGYSEGPALTAQMTQRAQPTQGVSAMQSGDSKGHDDNLSLWPPHSHREALIQSPKEALRMLSSLSG